MKELLRKTNGGQKQANDLTANATAAVYDSDSVTISGITGNLYTYTLPAANGYNSRAQLYSVYSGLTLIPNRSDSIKDYVSMGWATSEPMYVESYSGLVTYTNYSANPDTYTNVDIKSNRHIYTANKVALYYNDTNGSAVPTQVSLNIIANKKNKSGTEAYAESELAHTYTGTQTSFTMVISWPPVIEFNYSPKESVINVPLGARFIQ
ncbi:hypothetical protein JQN58_05235 [Aneurinibacillus sp. BA2021]|nr:hypothetical protein [Aneurinibacillus sp. BA2021]